MESIVPFAGYDVVQCMRCGAFYADNIGETMPLMHYYEMMSKYETEAFSVSQEALAEYALFQTTKIQIFESNSQPKYAEVESAPCCFRLQRYKILITIYLSL
ncbi:MAG: hypothetical protein ACFNUH_05730 [Bacteroidota bacterium]